jgi:hypothetical protein
MVEKKGNKRGELAQAILIGGLGLGLAVGGIVYALESERGMKERCFIAGQIDEKGLKTPIYNPKTESGMLFGEYQRRDGFSGSGINW